MDDKINPSAEMTMRQVCTKLTHECKFYEQSAGRIT